MTAKTTTGTAVPRPNSAGMATGERRLVESWISFRNSAADVGQKARANRMPSRNAPHMPIASMRRCIFSLTPGPEKLTWIIPSKNMAIRISSGPSSSFMNPRRNDDTSLLASRLSTSSTPSTR